VRKSCYNERAKKKLMAETYIYAALKSAKHFCKKVISSAGGEGGWFIAHEGILEQGRLEVVARGSSGRWSGVSGPGEGLKSLFRGESSGEPSIRRCTQDRKGDRKSFCRHKRKGGG